MVEFQDEITLFYNASSKLTRASTPLEQLEAVSDYARDSGASSGALFYFEFDDDHRTEEVVAEWVTGTVIPFEVGTCFRLPQMSTWHTLPAGPILNRDLRTEGHLSSITREIDLSHHIYASVILRLFSRGRWVGAILFGWNEAREFDERDKRIYTVLQQLAAPVVDSVRLFEQTQKRANELDILYTASRQLVAASTPEELLEAASAYARDQGADSGYLIYFENYQPGWCEVVATWAQTPAHQAVSGERVKLEGQSFPDFWMSRPNQPTLVDDVMNTDYVDPVSRERFRMVQARGVAELPLYINGRWVGFINFIWMKPYPFDEQDKRIYTALQQQIAAAAAAIRLFEQTQKRAVELEIAKSEMDILYAISRQLVSASTPAEILEAVSTYARARGAQYARLSYFVDFQPQWLEVVAAWSSGGEPPTPVGTMVDVSKRRLPQYSMAHPDRPTFVPDLQASDMSGPDMRQHAILFNVRSVVQLPMYVNGRWIGILTFDWSEPQVFNERDERIYAALQQQVSPVIDSIRLLDQSRARTLELEQANQEINLLYRTSEIINSANTYEEVVKAVAQFDPDADTVTLMLWDKLDWAASSFLEVMVVIDRVGKTPIKVGDRLPTENFPIAKVMMGERVWIFEDARTDPRLDPITAQTWELLNIRAFMGPALYVQHRWVGGITFHSSVPRQYSEREARLFAGVGDLVIAAIQRIRYQQEIEAARDEIDALYRVGEVINVASSFTELVNALSSIVSSAEAVALHLWEGWNFETASYVETVAGTGYMQSLIGHRIPMDALSFTQQTQNDRILVIEDITTDARFDAATVAGFMLRRQVASISIRLHVNQQWIGALVFQNDRPRTFSEREQRLAVGIGDYVMGAVERIRARDEMEVARQRAEALAQTNTHLLEQTQRRATELEAAKDEIDTLYRIGEAINAANSFTELVNALSGIISGATAVGLYRWEDWDFETATYAEAVAATGYMLSFVGQRTPKEALSYTQDTKGDRLLVVEDSASHAGYDDTTRATYVERDMRAQISIRLYVNQSWIGALVFHSTTPRRFSEREQRLALGIGDYVLGAVERIRAREETEAARQRAEAFAEQAHQLAVLEERNRLARELHDSVSQALYGIALGAQTARTILDRDPRQAVEPLDYVLALSEAGLAEMRALIFELRPETLEKEGLIEALSKQVVMLQARHGFEVKTVFCPEPSISIQLKEAVYWIAREALHNVVKHANASTIELRVTCTPDLFTLLVMDNGTGFDIDTDFSGHLGLKSMSERAVRIGGTLHIQSSSGAGTDIQLQLPLNTPLADS